MIITVIVLILATVFFVDGRIRSDIVALCAMLLLVVFQILTPEEALAGFSNSVVIMMVGLFVVGGAVFQTGLAKMISNKILRMAGNNANMLFLLVMIATSLIGSVVSNTGTVALMLPIVVSLSTSAGISASRLLMPLAFASSMGGMMTLIGTPPNMIISNTLVENGYEPLKFFTFLPSGIVCVVVGILVLLPLTKWLLDKKNTSQNNRRRSKSLDELAREYGLTDNLFRLRVIPDSIITGKSIRELNLQRTYHLNVLEVRRSDERQHRFMKTITQHVAQADFVVSTGDIIYVSGNIEDVRHLAEDFILEMLHQRNTETTGGSHLHFYDIGIAEIVPLASCSILGKTVRDAGFRSKYDVNVLGIRRKSDYLLHDLGEETIHAGDVLLVQGTWANISRMKNDDTDWVVLGQPLEEAAKVTRDYKAPIAGIIMLLMIAAMAFDFIPIAPVTAVLIASVLMILTGCFHSVEAAYKTINWESIILIGAMMPMSTALQKTGASDLIATSLVSMLGQYGPMALMVGIYFTTSLMTMFISNTATAVLLAPIAMMSAQQVGMNPIPFLFAVSIAASMCFASPFSTPPNALVMPAGKYTFMDYIKVGLPLQIIMGIVMVLVLPLLFPF
ncbi:MAG: SLC13 family permease [Marinilabiliaceae bacterium]|nr:SLC13 family permease [Marinilabiliaceae bacterium]